MDAAQIVKDVYDPVTQALRVSVGLSNSLLQTGDAPQIVQLLYEPTTHSLRAVVVGAASGTNPGPLDSAQAWKLWYDISNRALRIVR